MFNRKSLMLCAGVSLSLSHFSIASDFKSASHTMRSFEKVFGVTKGKRRNHTKGFCFVGELSPFDEKIKAYSVSSLFSGKSSVIGRLSHKDGNNAQPDNKPHEYGMSLSITTATGERHLMSLNTLDFFPVATPEEFAELMHAKAQGGAAVKAFKQRNKDLQRFKAYMSKKKKVLRPYEGGTYNSVNSFYLIDAEGKKSGVRWSFTPATEQQIVLPPKPDFFFENLQENLKVGDVSWNMNITFAGPNDDVDNPAIPWSKDNKTIVGARLKVVSIQTEKNGRCDAINYDPLVVSDGFAPSDDPMLKTRSAIYALGFGKRMGEKSSQ